MRLPALFLVAFLFVCSSVVNVQAQLTNNLEAYWGFDNDLTDKSTKVVWVVKALN